MAFKKGDPRINRAGRAKGAEGKVKSDFRAFLADTLADNREKFTKTLKAAKGAMFLKIYLEALSYVTPKLKQIEFREVPELEAFLQMTPEERQEELTRLQEILKNEKHEGN